MTWIVPRDSWLLDRAALQPGPEFVEDVGARFAVRSAAIEEAESADDLFDRLDASGSLPRLSDDVRPSGYRCATVTVAELAQPRRIDDVVRLVSS